MPRRIQEAVADSRVLDWKKKKKKKEKFKDTPIFSLDCVVFATPRTKFTDVFHSEQT